MATPESLEAVRSAIRAALGDFVREPFYNLREADPQADLLLRIRSALGNPIVPALLSLEKGAKHAHTKPIETSRVHLELKIDDTKVSDIVVFAEVGNMRRIRLRCYPAGPIDVVATVDGQDVDIVIEIKSAPSSTQAPTFIDDLEKLADLKRRNLHLHPMFVVFDKSLPAAGAVGKPRMDWLRPVAAPSAIEVEVFYVDEHLSVRSVMVPR